MYAHFYQLSEEPFNLTPDPKYQYINESTREALATVLHGIRSRKGFIALVGEAGTGKTTMLKRVLEEVEADTKVVFVFNPAVSFDELLEYICIELGVSTDGRGRLHLLERLNHYLLDQLTAGRNVVVMIDEAQTLDDDVLEELRLLSNLETAKEKILQIVLSGQPELDDKLRQPKLRQLRQRIGVRASLRAMRADEIDAYTQTRLSRAGSPQADLFTAAALRKAWQAAGGIPRVINVLCDNAMMIAFAEGKSTISARVMAQAIRDLNGETFSDSIINRLKGWASAPAGRFAMAVCVLAVVAPTVWWARTSGPDSAAIAPAPSPEVASSNTATAGSAPVPIFPAAVAANEAAPGSEAVAGLAVPSAPPAAANPVPTAVTANAVVAQPAPPVAATLPSAPDPLPIPAAAPAGAPPEATPPVVPTVPVAAVSVAEPAALAPGLILPGDIVQGGPVQGDPVNVAVPMPETIAEDPFLADFDALDPLAESDPLAPDSASTGMTGDQRRASLVEDSMRRAAVMGRATAARIYGDRVAREPETVFSAQADAKLPVGDPGASEVHPRSLEDARKLASRVLGPEPKPTTPVPVAPPSSPQLPPAPALSAAALSPAETVARAPGQPIVGRFAKVARGDTLWAIALQYYGSVDSAVLTGILQYNADIANPHQLDVGSYVFLPFLDAEAMVKRSDDGGYEVLLAESPDGATVERAKTWAAAALPGRALRTVTRGSKSPVKILYAVGYGSRASALDAAKAVLGRFERGQG